MLLNFRNWMTQSHFLIGAGLLRVCFGIIIIYNYLIHYRQREFLWGDDGEVNESKQNSQMIY
ncbi:hypothetical protein BK126_19790 [Paenibacillus sp. FSL H7-0326]|nr:hypothetical protein BK126_19790 [Paenibacillus sp. FSL H7-0326]